MSERNFRVNSPKHNRIHSSNNPPPKKDSEKNPSGPLGDKIAKVRKESEQEWKDKLESLTTELFQFIEELILEEAKDLTCTSYNLNLDIAKQEGHSGAIELFEHFIGSEWYSVNGRSITGEMIIEELCAKLKNSGLKASYKRKQISTAYGKGMMLTVMEISWD